MATEWQRTRCRERIEQLSGSADDSEALRRQAIEILHGAIGFDRWCTLLLDPETLVISQGIGYNDWYSDLPRLNLYESGLGDVNDHAMLARSRDHVGISVPPPAAISPARGAGARCTPATASATSSGASPPTDRGSWGDFRLYRNSDDAPFDADDAR